MNSATPANHYNSNKYFLIAFGLINILAFTLLLCMLSLLAGITIGKWQFPLAGIAAIVVNGFAARFFMGEKAKGFVLKSTLSMIVIVTCTMIVAAFTYDLSFDGQWYHQENVFRLKQGYNPVYQHLTPPPDEQSINTNGWCLNTDTNSHSLAKTNTDPVNVKFVNLNYFAKGTEVIEAAIYQTTNHIESSKAVNIIILIASFFLCLSLLYKVERIGTFKKWLLAIILSFNPITVKELLTFCVDGFGGSLILCLLVLFCFIFLDDNPFYFFLLAGLITVTVNVKFTTLFFTVIFCAGFLLVLLVYKKMATFKKMLAWSIAAGLIGVFCCGFSPYINNFMQKDHNMFYGLADTKIEIIRLTPTPFLKLNRFQNLYLSLAAHQGWDLADKETPGQIPKIPFTINKNDIKESTDVEPSVSGFGPFFSGSLVVAIVLFIISLIYFRKTQAFKLAGAVLLMIIFTIIAIPDSWWSRFVPQLWLMPVIILAMAEFISFRGNRPLKGILYVSLLLNIAWSSLVFVFVLFNTARANYQLQQIKALNEPISIEYCNYRSFKSNGIRFIEAGIPISKDTTARFQYFVTYSTTKVGASKPLPNLPRSFIVKLAEKVTGNQ